MALTESWNGSLAPQALEKPVGLSCEYACHLGFVLLSLWAEPPIIPVPWVVAIDLCWLQNNRLRQQSECQCSGILMPGLGQFCHKEQSSECRPGRLPVKYLMTIRWFICKILKVYGSSPVLNLLLYLSSGDYKALFGCFKGQYPLAHPLFRLPRSFFLFSTAKIV